MATLREVSTRELKNGLSELVRAVESGERLVLTRNGRPVAALVPLSDLGSSHAERILGELAARGVVRAAALVRPPGAFRGPTVPARGKLGSAMILEDRR